LIKLLSLLSVLFSHSSTASHFTGNTGFHDDSCESLKPPVLGFLEAGGDEDSALGPENEQV
jgi:hypothetical protein